MRLKAKGLLVIALAGAVALAGCFWGGVVCERAYWRGVQILHGPDSVRIYDEPNGTVSIFADRE